MPEAVKDVVHPHDRRRRLGRIQRLRIEVVGRLRETAFEQPGLRDAMAQATAVPQVCCSVSSS